MSMMPRLKVPPVVHDGKPVKAAPHALVCTGPVLVQQHHAADCDINVIMARFAKSGLLPQVSAPPRFLDLTTVPSFVEAHAIAANASAVFASLDAKVRARFDNDPLELLRAVDDPAMGPELVRLGLAELRGPSPERSSPGMNPEPSVKDGKAPRGRSDDSKEAS